MTSREELQQDVDLDWSIVADETVDVENRLMAVRQLEEMVKSHGDALPLPSDWRFSRSAWLQKLDALPEGLRRMAERDLEPAKDEEPQTPSEEWSLDWKVLGTVGGNVYSGAWDPNRNGPVFGVESGDGTVGGTIAWEELPHEIQVAWGNLHTTSAGGDNGEDEVPL